MYFEIHLVKINEIMASSEMYRKIHSYKDTVHVSGIGIYHDKTECLSLCNQDDDCLAVGVNEAGYMFSCSFLSNHPPGSYSGEHEEIWIKGNITVINHRFKFSFCIV